MKIIFDKFKIFYAPRKIYHQIKIFYLKYIKFPSNKKITDKSETFFSINSDFLSFS